MGLRAEPRLRAALLSLGVACGLLLLKLAAWSWTGSSAILSDALESVTNVAGAAFGLGALLFAVQPADAGHPYGHGKIEFVSAAFEGGLISFAALASMGYALRDLWIGPQVEALGLGLGLTALAAVINAGLGGFLVREGRRLGSPALLADGKHVLTDVQTSIGVLVGLGLVAFSGRAWFDPLAALVVAVNLAWIGARIVRDAVGGLLDAVDPELLQRIVQAFEASRRPGVIQLHQPRLIRSGGQTHVDIHLTVPEFWTVEESHHLLRELERDVLGRLALEGDIAVHADPCRRELCFRCELEVCPVRLTRFTGRVPLDQDDVLPGLVSA